MLWNYGMKQVSTEKYITRKGLNCGGKLCTWYWKAACVELHMMLYVKNFWNYLPGGWPDSLKSLLGIENCNVHVRVKQP